MDNDEPQKLRKTSEFLTRENKSYRRKVSELNKAVAVNHSANRYPRVPDTALQRTARLGAAAHTIDRRERFREIDGDQLRARVALYSQLSMETRQASASCRLGTGGPGRE